jgi:uncharacterized protein (TIGR00290 family)
MDSKKKVTISWSGGKDSALALYQALQDKSIHIVGLHTVFNATNHRVGLHGIHESLIDKQAHASGLPLTKLYLPESQTHEEYRKVMTTFFDQCKSDGVSAVVFGDIFLQDLKDFREELLSVSGLTGIYPLWKQPSGSLMNEFLSLGFKTIVCAADARYFSIEDVGRTIDRQFVADLHRDVDVCGENGEFHTFVYEGPIFKAPVKFIAHEKITRSYKYKITTSSGEIIEESKQFFFQELS